MKTCYIYVRRASYQQTDNKLSALKKAKCIEFAKKHNFKVLGIYEDIGVSGNTLERKALRELIRCSKYNHVNAIIVFALDQLSRDVTNFLKISVAFEKKKIQILSVTEGNISASSFITKILASLTQYKSGIEK